MHEPALPSVPAGDAGGQPLDPLSPALRAVVAALHADDGALCQCIYDEIRGTVSDYRLSTDGGFPDDLKAVLSWHIRLWHSALLEARQPSDALLAHAGQLARRRAHQGIALDSLLRAFRIGSAGLWRGLIEAAQGDAVLEKELLRKVSPYLLHHSDIVSHHVAQAYMDEQFQQASWRDRVRGELWSVISARREDAEAFARYCAVLQLDPAAPYVAIAFSLRDSAAGGRFDAHAFQRIARELGMAGDSCMYLSYRDHLVVWAPSLRGEARVDGDRRIAVAAQQVLDRIEPLQRAGVGLAGSGAAGWWTSLEQAFRALEHGGDHGGGATRYSHILLDEAIAHSDSTRQYLDAILERLAAEPHLLDTLRAYFQHRQHRKAVASALGVHPNTVDHRLQRIESVLGGDFHDVTWLATLSAALRLHRGPGGSGA